MSISRASSSSELVMVMVTLNCGMSKLVKTLVQWKFATLSWHRYVLTSGCGVGRHEVTELLGHTTGEVCGLKHRNDGELLASGGK